MKQLVFVELALLSHREKSARRIPFHRRSTLIRGGNDTGKSSVIKSLYWTLGAEPAVIHDRWRDAGVIASLKFTIDGAAYRMIRSGTRFCLFGADDRFIGTYTSVTTQLAPQLAELFNFRLVLRDKKEQDLQATPAFLFLPFYVDQDAGWNAKLKSFASLKQFHNPDRDALEFHMGVRPSAYYAAKSRVAALDAEMAPLRQERAVLGRVLERAEVKLGIGDLNLDVDAFRDEIEVILERAEALRSEEEVQRRRMSEAYTRLSAAEEQIQIVRAALKEHRDDRAFAEKLTGDTVQCPTCLAVYDNSFAERFAIAVDEDQCSQLLQDLDEEKRSAQGAYSAACQASDKARSLAADVHQLLAAKKEALKLADIVRSESRREAQSMLGDEIDELDRRTGELDASRVEAKAEMDKLDSKQRRREILSFYESQMEELLKELDVRGLKQTAIRRIDAKLNETGSDLPRALLAFYLAVIRTIAKHSTSTFCPMVIDSPNQQEQDAANWSTMKRILAEERPDEGQMILGVTDAEDFDIGGDIVALDRKHKVLRDEDYDDVRSEIVPLLDIGLSADTP